MADHLEVIARLRDCGEPSAHERLALGKALLAIKEQRLYQRLGHVRFESFLDSDTCPFGHTVCRHAMRLAERTELHGALGLGIGRLTELMRLTPVEASRLLNEGLPTGPLSRVSVRGLRRYILGRSSRGEDPEPPATEPLPRAIEHWSGQMREHLLNLLLQQRFGQDLGRVQVLLQGGASTSSTASGPSGPLEDFWPDARRVVPQRWVALTTHLESLEFSLGSDPGRVGALVQRLRQPIEAWERAVFYLDLCRRDPGRRDYYSQIRSACTAVEKILAGRDWHYNTDQAYLASRLARGRHERRLAIRPFWRRLFNEVSPPEQYRVFLGQLVSDIQEGEWRVTCADLYQAEFTLGCLRHRDARLFWQIASSHLGVHCLRLIWPEGGRKREQVIQLQSSAA